MIQVAVIHGCYDIELEALLLRTFKKDNFLQIAPLKNMDVSINFTGVKTNKMYS